MNSAVSLPSAFSRLTAHRVDRAFVAVLALMAAAAVVAQETTDPIAQARQLYYSTFYEEALEALDKAPTNRLSPSDLRSVREYRVMSLLALDRTAEADKVIEEMIRTDPSYRPPAQSAPPAFQSAFVRASARVMPSLARDQFNRANAEFEAKRYTDAAAGFDAVIRLVREAAVSLDDQDSAPMSTLKEIENHAARLAVASRSAQQQNAAATRTVFTSNDVGVTPPIPVRQDIPPWQGKLESDRFEGQLEIVVGVDGAVRSATITASIHPAYDRALVDAARKWRYRPASKEGRPVAYAETVTIRLAAPQQNE